MRDWGASLRVLACLWLLAGAGPAAAEAPIRIGLTLGLTGQYEREARYMYEAYVLWQEDVNRRHGLLGRPVQLVVRDDQSEPELSASLYEALITTDLVDLIVGPYSSTVALAASAVAERHGHPMLAAGASAVDIWQQGYRNTLGVYPPAPVFFEGMIELAAGNGIKSVAVLNERSLFARSAALGAVRIARDHGMRVIAHEEYERPLIDARPVLRRLRLVWPEMLIVGGYLSDTLMIARQAREVDLRIKAMAFSVGPALPEFAGSLAADADYVFGPSLWEPALKTPGNEEFVNRYRARWGRDPGYQAAAAWAAAIVLEAAVRRAGAVDRGAIRRMLLALEMETILPGRFEMDSNGLQIGHRPLIVQWQRGRKEIVWPRQYATARPVFPAPPWRQRVGGR